MSGDAHPSLEAYLDIEERDAQKIQTGNLKNLLRRMLRHKSPLVGGFIMILLGVSATLLEPRIFGYAIDEAILPRNPHLLKVLSLWFLFAVCLRVSTAIAQSYWFEVLGQRVTQDLRCELFSHLQKQPITVFDKNPAGRLLTRVTNDVASLSEMFSAGFVAMLGNFLLVSGILIWLLVLDLKLGLITLTIFPGMVVASVYFSKKLKISYREARSKLSALNAFLAENLLGMKVVNLFNRQKLHLERFRRINQWYADAQISGVRVYAYFQPTITWFSGLSIALVIWYGGRASLNSGLKLGVLVTYFSYLTTLFQPIREMADKWNVFLSGMASAERVFSILEWPTEFPATEALASIKEKLVIRGDIRFEDVWFAYDQEHWILKDFNLDIRAGSRIGVVGHTGAGKTTLISLLLRFYDPQRGRILLDGKDLRDYDKRALRTALGVVQQDVFLFSGSIADNITFWEKRETLELKSLGFEKVDELDERGTNLSIGEKQILAFARTYAANPGVWILDEATANMDSQSEKLLQTRFDEASREKTSILIAHRLATVRTADQIIVLNKGILIEQGNHAELLALGGLYSRLYRYQKAQQEMSTHLEKSASANDQSNEISER